jgi:hypothetical protein
MFRLLHKTVDFSNAGWSGNSSVPKEKVMDM